MNLKGSLSLLILHLLSKGPSHGYEISKHIYEKTEGVLNFKEGTLYPTLHGLERNGFIIGFDDVENGRRRRYYRLTEAGSARLDTEQAEWSAFVKAVNTVLQSCFER